MRLARAVNSLLALGGLQLNRVTAEKQLKSVPETAGKLVELTGPSGVGKTHLYDSIHSRLKSEWQSRQTATSHAQRTGFSFEISKQSSNIAEVLLKKKYENILLHDIPLWRKVRLYDFCAKEMATDIVARERILPSCGVFSDDGITHNFSREIIQIYEENSGFSSEAIVGFFRGRSVIFLDADESLILKNLEKRNTISSVKALNNWLAHMSRQDVVAMIRRTKENRKKLSNIISSFDVPILQLDAKNDIEFNQKQILGFIARDRG